MSMFGKHCKECDKDRMIEIFKNSCKKHLKQFDEQKKQHRKKGFLENIFDGLKYFFKRSRDYHEKE